MNVAGPRIASARQNRINELRDILGMSPRDTGRFITELLLQRQRHELDSRSGRHSSYWDGRDPQSTSLGTRNNGPWAVELRPEGIYTGVAKTLLSNDPRI